MDLTQPITYRNHDINDVHAEGDLLAGNQVTMVNYYGVEAVGYREKRSATDGMDASDVYLGGRTIRLTGTLYGVSLGDLYDRKALFVAAMLPTSAYAESPGDYGYLPLEFQVPTLDEENWLDLYIPQMIRARSLGSPSWLIDRDRVGGIDSRGYALDWEHFMEARDPRIYGQSEKITYLSPGGNTSSGTGSILNRGIYPTPINLLMYVPGSTNAERRLTLTVGGSQVKITLPASAQDQIARYNGQEKTLHVESQGVEVLRMDLLEFPAGIEHPLIAAGPSSYSWELRNASNVLVSSNAATRFWFWEAWA